MRVIDPKRIRKLMLIQEVSQREPAEAAGWRNGHSFATRLLSGEVRTVTPEKAARMSHFFEVGVTAFSWSVRPAMVDRQSTGRRRRDFFFFFFFFRCEAD